MIVRRFDRAADVAAWDNFLLGAKNQTFLFQRAFMDYHRDRFEDFSLIITDAKGKLEALIPANIHTSQRDVVVSHQGLTYGGIIVHQQAKLKTVLEVCYVALKYFSEHGFQTFKLKQFPSFYNPSPSDEVAYALFLLEAQLWRRDVAFVIDRNHRIGYAGNIRREGNKSVKAGNEVVEEATMTAFWNKILVPNLHDRFGVKPVHSLEEIAQLKTAFPENIRQFSVYHGEEIVAGAVLFLEEEVIHCQYLSASDVGRSSGALNHLFCQLTDHAFPEKRYFDFGIVNENEGKDINSGMLFWKESFGGRAQMHDFYNIACNNFALLEKFIL